MKSISLEEKIVVWTGLVSIDEKILLRNHQAFSLFRLGTLRLLLKWVVHVCVPLHEACLPDFIPCFQKSCYYVDFPCISQNCCATSTWSRWTFDGSVCLHNCELLCEVSHTVFFSDLLCSRLSCVNTELPTAVQHGFLVQLFAQPGHFCFWIFHLSGANSQDRLCILGNGRIQDIITSFLVSLSSLNSHTCYTSRGSC